MENFETHFHNFRSNGWKYGLKNYPNLTLPDHLYSGVQEEVLSIYTRWVISKRIFVPSLPDNTRADYLDSTEHPMDFLLEKYETVGDWMVNELTGVFSAGESGLKCEKFLDFFMEQIPYALKQDVLYSLGIDQGTNNDIFLKDDGDNEAIYSMAKALIFSTMNISTSDAYVQHEEEAILAIKAYDKRNRELTNNVLAAELITVGFATKYFPDYFDKKMTMKNIKENDIKNTLYGALLYVDPCILQSLAWYGFPIQMSVNAISVFDKIVDEVIAIRQREVMGTHFAWQRYFRIEELNQYQATRGGNKENHPPVELSSEIISFSLQGIDEFIQEIENRVYTTASFFILSETEMSLMVRVSTKEDKKNPLKPFYIYGSDNSHVKSHEASYSFYGQFLDRLLSEKVIDFCVMSEIADEYDEKTNSNIMEIRAYQIQYQHPQIIFERFSPANAKAVFSNLNPDAVDAPNIIYL